MGRLIDADLVKRAMTGWETDPTDEEIEFTIDLIPTVEAVPVVHGRWIHETCSVCNRKWDYNMVANADDWGYFDPMPDFCPNCGAKMDGKGENER